MGSRKLLLAMRLVGLGWYVAFCIVAGIVGGYWLDQRLETLPWLMLSGLLLGVVLAFYGVYKMVAPLMAGDDGNGTTKGK